MPRGLRRGQDRFLQNKDHQIEAECGSDAAGQEKEGGPRLVCVGPDSVAEEPVNAGQLQPVVEGEQDGHDDRVADEVAEHHLHVPELLIVPPIPAQIRR